MAQHEIETLCREHQAGYSLAQPFYVSDDIFERDVERVYLQRWLFVGHTSRIPNAGDYFLYEVAGESIIVIRDGDGELRALFNVCRHRGSRVCLESEGQAKKLVCPYHAWVYDHDGTLLAARQMPDEFDKRAFGLHRAHVRVVEGLIFVCLAAEPPPFEHEVRDIARFMRPHRLDRAKICRRTSTAIRKTLRSSGKITG